MIKIDLSDAIVASEKMRETAVSFYKSKIDSEPENIDYLLKLAHLLRESGRIEESLAYFSRIAELEPRNIDAIQMIAILSQRPEKIIPCESDFCPAPFLYIEDFLTDSELQSIWSMEKLDEKYFSHSTVSAYCENKEKDEINDDYRKSLTLYRDRLESISGWFLEKITSKLPDVWPYVQLSPFKPSRIEMQLTRHGNNEFFKIHQDSDSDDKRLRNRTLTYVYYFHKEPKCFEGGEILFFDTNTKENDLNNRYTKLTPKNNSIIFFPSNFFHQVTTVHMKKDEFKDGRFAIHGWLHK